MDIHVIIYMGNIVQRPANIILGRPCTHLEEGAENS